ncbi:ABC transporter substrate-binding protein [Cohnella caldifontis]|uniref:ABC transporter substrate-binding protein n=1 Tax=Cohnella caldifontis TaxID=3027471 RepID=UPI0023ECAFFA|nr:sugar ABC transporter substrate-binding protein [Cohnella sp. YIM B05605]
MNRFKKWGIASAVPLLVGALLSACGSSGGSGAQSSPGSAGESVSGGAAGGESKPYELRVATWQTEETNTAILNEAKKKFEAEHPGATVKIEASPYENYMTKLQTELGAGDPPDLIQVGEQNFSRYVKKNIVVDLTPFAEGKYDLNDITPNVKKLMLVDGKLPVMSVGGATIGVYYNKKLFDAAGIPYPQDGWTWEQFRDIAKKLTIRQGGKIKQYGANLNLGKDWVEPFVVSNGGSYLSPDGSTAVGYLNADATVDAFKKIYDLYNVDNVAPNPAELIALKGIDLFATGQVAMNVNGSWAQSDLRNNPDIEFGVVSLPTMSTGKQTSLLYTSGFGIAQQSKHQQEAFDFLMELTSPDSEIGPGWAKSNLAVSQKLAASSKQNEDPYLGEFVKQLDNAIVSGYFANSAWGSVGDKLLAPAIQDILLQKNVDIKAKLTDLAGQIDTELKRAAE